MNVHILGKSNNMISLLLDALHEKTKKSLKINIICNIFVDDDPPFKMEKIKSIEIKNIRHEEWSGNYENLLLGVIRVPTKKTVYDFFYESYQVNEQDYYKLIHPSSIISAQSEIGSGVYIGPGSIVAPYVSIDNMVSINRRVSIGHHTRIGKFSSLNPGSNIAGGSIIGSHTTIGMGTNIFDGVNIGSNTIVGAGSVVTKSIPDNVVAFGAPARVIRKNLS